jgi:hypothetical protein
MGNTAQGTVLAGQVQGVRQGTPALGISIATDGVITVDSQTIQGVMKLGQTAATANAAFNGYTWPTGAGAPNSQLTSDGTGVLRWTTSVSPWTQKGQLIAATGVDAEDTVDVGANTSILVADSAQNTNLIWSDSLDTAILLPIGNSVQRPSSPVAGQFRINTSIGRPEWYNGTQWETIPSNVPPAGFVPETSRGGAAEMPWGLTVNRPSPAQRGYMRYNSGTQQFEYYDATKWNIVGANPDPETYTEYTPRTSSFGASLIASGDGASRPSPTVNGMLRLNSGLIPSPSPEIYGGGKWNQIAYVSSVTYPDLVISSNVNMGGTYFCNNLTINAGVTVTMTSSDILIFCTGSATINGNIVGNGRVSGGVGWNLVSFSNTVGPPGMNVGGGLSGSPGAVYSISTAFCGSGGNAGVCGASAAITTGYPGNTAVGLPIGGSGGGGFAVVARGPVVHNNSSTISVNGTDGGDGVNYGPYNTEVTGAGGGSGGCCVLQSLTSVVSTGVISANGGAGGDPFIFAGYASNAAGGGGGGNIILQAPSVTQGGNYFVSGGLGSVGNAAGIAAGGGGSFGGSGGYGVLGSANGFPGVIAQSGSPFNPNFI